MRGSLLMIAACLLIATLTANYVRATPISELLLVSVGDDCIYSIEVFNKVLTKKQMRTMKVPESTFAFITDHCETERISAGIFGVPHVLTRESLSSLGTGAAYTDGAISVKVRQGRRRLKVVHPPPAACDEGFVESSEFFDAVVTVRKANQSFTLHGTLLKPGCTKENEDPNN
jgi:hypothetical protein